MSRIRKAALTGGILAASLLFAVGGASAAHAEMDSGEAPVQADVDWTPGAGGTYSTGTSTGTMNDWVADQYQKDGTSIFGWDYYSRWDGLDPQSGDADKFAHNYNYKNCTTQWWHPGQLACTD